MKFMNLIKALRGTPPFTSKINKPVLAPLPTVETMEYDSLQVPKIPHRVAYALKSFEDAIKGNDHEKRKATLWELCNSIQLHIQMGEQL